MDGMRRRQSIVSGVLAFCVALSAAAVFVRANDDQANHKYPDISIKDLKQAIAQKKVTLIDANGTDSWRDGHIPGAINYEASAGRIAKLLPRDKNALVVAYCGGPQCMAYQAAAQRAVELGYTNVKHLSAGISGWKSAGEKVEKAADEKAG
jgi:rhodanese-related sulfurtransferase